MNGYGGLLALMDMGHGQRPQGLAGRFAGYNGPMPGTPEWQALRAQGQHPLMDWFRANGGQSLAGLEWPHVPMQHEQGASLHRPMMAAKY